MTKDEKANWFDSLPDSVILNIFHKLDLKSLLSCSGVCLRFYKIAQDRSLKRDIDLSGKDVDIGLLRKVSLMEFIILTVIAKRFDSIKSD